MKAYRRPITDTERNELKALYADINAKLTQHQDAVRVFLHAVLTNPHFLFKFEGGQSINGGYALTPYEILANTSLLLNNKAPSILDINNASAIVTNRTQFSAYVNRLLATDAGKKVLQSFLKQWLGVNISNIPEKNTDKFPHLTEAVKSAMIKELDAFIAHVVNQNKLTVETLLTSPYSVLEPALAQFYGEAQSGQVSVSELRKGILTKGSYLAVNAGSLSTIPTRRGAAVLYNLFCQNLAGLPAGIEVNVKETAGKTTRELFEMHAQNPECRSCHAILDPIGFGLENYDADGSYRSLQEGQHIDPAATLTNLPFSQLSFQGPSDMIDQIAAAPEVKGCLVRQAFRFTNGRLEKSADDPILAKALQDFKASAFDVRAVFESLLTNTLANSRK